MKIIAGLVVPSLPSPMSSWTIAVIFVVLGMLWSLTAHLRRASKAKQGDRRLPPGPPGLPILGNLLMLGDLPHHTLHQLANKYGPIMYIRLGLVPTVVVSSSEAAELFLKTHDLVFASRPHIMGAQYISYGGNKAIAFSPYGPYWRNIRKFCTIELLSVAKVDSFKQMRREEVGLFVQSLKDESGAVVDVSAKVGSLVEDMTYRMVIGSKDAGFHLKPVVDEALKLLGAINLADYIPCLGSLDLQASLQSL